jgi:LysR family transcriptional activator of glutamate synthase operon
MELSQIRAFTQVARHKSYTRAAESLFLTQSAISQKIAAREEELGCDLFEQIGKKIQFTPAGERFLTYAERVLTLVSEANESLGDFRKGTKGRITLAAIGSTTLYLLPDILYKFRLLSPEADIALRTEGADDVKESVKRGTADIGIVGSHLKTPELVTARLFHDKIGPFVHPQHRLAGRRTIRLDELAHEPMIHLGVWKSWQDHVMSVFRNAGITPRIHLQLDSIDGVKRMVERGLGFAILPHISTREEVKGGTLIPLRFNDAPSLDREILLIHRRDKQLSPILKKFIDFVLVETKRFR